MFSFFTRKKEFSTTSIFSFLQVDLHSHLLAGIDDGVQTESQALEIIELFQQYGYRKIITTPHILWDFYKNTPEIIRTKLEKLRFFLQENQIDLPVEAAAEYYVDEHFLQMLQNHENLLCFGEKKYLLFETGFLNYPAFWEEAIFLIKANGYQPVLAHPERYVYVQNDFNFLEKVLELGVLLQVNMLSLIGYYSLEAKKTAEKIIDANLAHFLATDCHHIRQAKTLQNLVQSPFFRKVQNYKWLNQSL
ncbi:MAG: CpsB/CapC family capsule biosynthesis tyrosine phosphatase [Raineya sp.]|nr:capsular biosynthesis protein [Raineya sp.]MDW8295761.1 CpsB/CapC family capsule biosynthesis tyrosine phosphatase [Raineya sp.]